MAESRTRAVSRRTPSNRGAQFGTHPPRILSGKLPVFNLPLGRPATRPLPLDRPMVETAFDRLYGGADTLSVTYREGRAARAKLMTDLQRDMAEADAGPLRHRDSLTTLTGWLISSAAIR